MCRGWGAAAGTGTACTGSAGQGSRQGLSREQAACVPGQAELRPPGGWRRWERGARAGGPVGAVEAAGECWHPEPLLALAPSGK